MEAQQRFAHTRSPSEDCVKTTLARRKHWNLRARDIFSNIHWIVFLHIKIGNACYSVIKFNMRLMRSFGTWDISSASKSKLSVGLLSESNLCLGELGTYHSEKPTKWLHVPSSCYLKLAPFVGSIWRNCSRWYTTGQTHNAPLNIAKCKVGEVN